MKYQIYAGSIPVSRVLTKREEAESALKCFRKAILSHNVYIKEF